MKQTVTLDLKWYETHQNNSGGHFYVDDAVAQYVLVQATSAKEAQHKMEEITESSGNDWCECCGERWYFDFDEEDGTDSPVIYSTPIAEYKAWMKGCIAKLHYYTGVVETVEIPKRND